MLASLWVVGIVVSLYGGDDLQTWLRTSVLAGRDSAALCRVGDAVVRLGRLTGLARLHEALEGRSFGERSLWQRAGFLPPPLPSPSPRRGVEPGPVRVAATVSRVLVVGASTIQFHLGVELERALRARYPALAVQRVGKLSTGLTRPDVFDWPAKLRELVADFHPDLVVANFGGNDAQGMVLAGGEVAPYGTGRWEATYRERVREIATIAREGGARVLWLGMSTTRDPVLNRRMERINAISDEAARASGADVLSIWDLGADARGHFQDVITIDGVPTRTRLADGKHFSRAGASFVAGQICQRLAERYIFVAEPAHLPPPRADTSRR